jgi:ethanolamine utilization microcompartment shell protein EutL
MQGKTMATDITEERQLAHTLLDMLPQEKLTAVRGLLEVMVEPLSRSLAFAPVEEEEVTPETAEALARARDSLARGEGIPHEDILHEFGQDK